MGVEASVSAIYGDYEARGTFKWGKPYGATNIKLIESVFNPLAAEPVTNADADMSPELIFKYFTNGNMVNTELNTNYSPMSILFRFDQALNTNTVNEVRFQTGSAMRENHAGRDAWGVGLAFGTVFVHEVAHTLGLFDEYLELAPSGLIRVNALATREHHGKDLTPTFMGTRNLKIDNLERTLLNIGMDDPNRLHSLVSAQPGSFLKKIVQQEINLYKIYKQNTSGSPPLAMVEDWRINTRLLKAPDDNLPGLPQAEPFDPAPLVPFGQNGTGMPPSSFTLQEDVTVGARVTADVLMPADTTELRFVLSDINFVDNGNGPADAFEFAILDADGVPITKLTSMTGTDAALNIQGDGTVSANSLISIRGLGPDGRVGHGPVVVTVDLSGVAPQTKLRLYFDVIGFGGTGSRLTVSDAQFVTPGEHLGPVAVADQATTNEDSLLTVNAALGLLRNDIDLGEGNSLVVTAINGAAVAVGQTVTLASGALLLVNADGSFSYDPNGRFESLAPRWFGTGNLYLHDRRRRRIDGNSPGEVHDHRRERRAGGKCGTENHG